MKGGGNEIVLLVEGKTENAIKPVLKQFLDARCEAEEKPKVRLSTKPLDSRLLKERVLRDQVRMNLKHPSVIGVIALIDVVCSGRDRQFENADDAIRFLEGAAPNEPRYRAHAAQYDFEAWLLPYWDSIASKLNQKKQSPGANPETVNHDHPPSRHLRELYRKANLDYDKPRDALAILNGKDLTISAAKCSQFKAFLNSLLFFTGCVEIP
jgi:hypothetical protein